MQYIWTLNPYWLTDLERDIIGDFEWHTVLQQMAEIHKTDWNIFVLDIDNKRKGKGWGLWSLRIIFVGLANTSPMIRTGARNPVVHKIATLTLLLIMFGM